MPYLRTMLYVPYAVPYLRTMLYVLYVVPYVRILPYAVLYVRTIGVLLQCTRACPLVYLVHEFSALC